MSAFAVTLIIAIILSHFGQYISWIIGGFLIILVLITSLLINGMSLQYFSLAILSILGYNLGLIFSLTISLAKTNNPATKI